MSNKSTQEFAGGYLDGINVKISEKYKPPPKINLLMTYAQRLSLNEQVLNNTPKYDFNVENTVLERVNEWKTARSVLKEEKKLRLEKLREENERVREERRKKQDELEKEKSDKIASDSASLSFNVNSNNAVPAITPNYYNFPVDDQVLMPTQAGGHSYSNILTPIPLYAKEQKTVSKADDKSPFNISEFEADTSSPFDHVALKSINDMEELAQVLRSGKMSYEIPSTSAQSNYSINASNYNYIPPIPAPVVGQTSSYSHVNGYYYNPENYAATNHFITPPYNYYNSADFRSSSMLADDKSYHCESVPDLVKNLDNTHLDNVNYSPMSPSNNAKTARPKSSEFLPPKRPSDNIEEINSLPLSVHEMVRCVSAMGFPLSRVVRVCKKIGNDQKRIVEHLLAMSELLDLGFTEEQASDALLLSNNDRDKALDRLIS